MSAIPAPETWRQEDSFKGILGYIVNFLVSLGYKQPCLKNISSLNTSMLNSLLSKVLKKILRTFSKKENRLQISSAVTTDVCFSLYVKYHTVILFLGYGANIETNNSDI